MHSTSRFFAMAGLASLFLVYACRQEHTRQEIERAMQRYDSFIQQMAVDSIASLYTVDGDLGGIAHGRDSIRRFLNTFKNVRVLAQSSVTSSIDINGDRSIQKGTYRQTALVAANDTVRVKGEFIANWQWIPSVGWRIKRMTTKPMP